MDRKTILEVHLAKRRIEADSFELDRLVTASDGFSGAELEQAIVAGLYSAHAQGQKLNDQHLLDEIH